jgi:hypothetical protein
MATSLVQAKFAKQIRLANDVVPPDDGLQPGNMVIVWLRVDESILTEAEIVQLLQTVSRFVLDQNS